MRSAPRGYERDVKAGMATTAKLVIEERIHATGKPSEQPSIEDAFAVVVQAGRELIEKAESLRSNRGLVRMLMDRVRYYDRLHGAGVVEFAIARAGAST